MGLIQSCLGKKTKVGVVSEDESEADRKIEKEVRKEEEEDIIHTKPLPWLMFAAKPGPSRSDTDEVNSSTVTEVVEKKGGVAFSIDYKSSVPKLPPINLNRAGVQQGEDYEKWKGSCLFWGFFFALSPFEVHSDEVRLIWNSAIYSHQIRIM